MEQIHLKNIISSFTKSTIQSEAEVRSKLIVPLIEYLGYPPELRSEEFPIYGFEGGKQIPAKNADFLLFSDSMFASYRKRIKSNIDWVQNHSLLVFEAKKTGEMPDLFGQPQYYTMWSRAVAYLITDGISIKGYYSSIHAADKAVLDCQVIDLADHYHELIAFSYTKILQIKKEKLDPTPLKKIIQAEQTVREDNSPNNQAVYNEVSLPSKTISMMRNALGKNSIGIPDIQVAERFLQMTDSFLQNDMRYDIPRYMLQIPRRFVDAKIQVNNEILPIMVGTVIQYYWNEYEIYEFSNSFFELQAFFFLDKMYMCVMNYHVKDKSVSKRLVNLERVQRVLQAKEITIFLDIATEKIKPIIIPNFDRKKEIELTQYWINEQEKLKTIEDYYGIEFIQSEMPSFETAIELYEKVDYVYCSITKEANCHIPVTGKRLKNRIVIDELALIDSKPSNLSSLRIHNFVFIPNDVYCLPAILSAKTKAIDACVTFTVSDQKSGLSSVDN